MNEKKFRYLLILYALFTFAGVIVALIPGGYSQTLSDAYDNEPQSWIAQNLWVMLAIAIPLLIASVSGFVGLYLFKKWGRTLSLCLTVVSPILSLFFGPTLSKPLESMFFEVSTLLWGAILTLAYYSAINGRFSDNH